MRLNSLIVCALLGLVLAAYWPAGGYDFVAYDDPIAVTHEPMVNQGLRSAAVLWAWTAPHNGNWTPITTLNLIADCSFFGLRPGAFHWENIAWHAVNTLLVFLVWQHATRATWPSALLAALFALHPLHVESVAWIAQRKDQVSTAFWLLSIAAYVRYARQPGRARFAWVVVAAALALMSKPMAITLPFTLLLFDYWPLQRWPERSWRVLIREKAILFLMAGALLVVTVLAEKATGALDFGARLPLGARLENAVVSYLRYLGKTVWPEQLSPFYPHPPAWPWWSVAGSVLVLAAITWLAWRQHERQRWLAFGWCWFVGTLVPVIGIVQTGSHALADRYTYVSLLGIFVIVAWGLEALNREHGCSRLAPALGVLMLAACFIRTAQQLPVWKDGSSLVAHLEAAIGRHSVVHAQRGTLLGVLGRPRSEVAAEFRRGAEADPADPFFPNELGMMAASEGRFAESREWFAQARAAVPENAGTASYAALAALQEGQIDDAVRFSEEAIRLHPRASGGHLLLGRARLRQRDLSGAIAALERATRHGRWDVLAWNERGVACNEAGRLHDALKCFERAVWINPTDPGAAANLAQLRARIGMPAR